MNYPCPNCRRDLKAETEFVGTGMTFRSEVRMWCPYGSCDTEPDLCATGRNTAEAYGMIWELFLGMKVES